MRLFVAAEIPEGVRTALETLLASFASEIPEVRWADASGIHLTLRFLGDADPGRIEPLSKALGAAAGSVRGGVPLRAGGVGAFGPKKSPRVVWAGIADESGDLGRLVSAIEAGCAGVGFPPEDRAYHPHLTLARPKAPSRALVEAIERREDAELGAFTLSSFFLFRSTLRPQGAVHEKLAEFPLAGSESGKP